MINTTKGPMDENDLEKKVEVIDNDNERTTAIEYYLGDELVHRSVHVHLKRNVMLEGIAQMIG